MRSLRLDVVKCDRLGRSAGPAATGLVSLRRSEATRAATAIVQSARDEAATIVARARTEAATIRSAAQDDGLTAGERAWADAAAELARQRADAITSLERDCILLSVEIARRIIRETVAIDAGAVAELVAHACARLRRDAALKLWIAPCHASLAQQIVDRVGNGRVVEVEYDSSLDEASCVAECGGVRVDGRLSVLLATIRRRLLGESGEEAM